MIVCSCNVICSRKIKEALEAQGKKPSVSLLLKELGCSSVCGTCISNIVKEIKEHYSDHSKEDTDQCGNSCRTKETTSISSGADGTSA